jgi:uncharacterized protein (TIGR03083 family)
MWRVASGQCRDPGKLPIMETSPDPWIGALRHSHDRLQALAGPLGLDQLEQRSYASEWSVAQVLSHLGSGAEIFGLFLAAGLAGQDPPGREAFGPIWNTWNAKDPQTQAADALQADELTVARFESIGPDERARLRLQVFGMDLDLTGLARMRVSEHALHTWDVAVALDPSETVAPDAVGLLIDTVGQLAARSAKPDGQERRLLISTTDPERRFILETGEAVSLTESGSSDGQDGWPELRLPAEALVRLVYGRLGPHHTPPVQADGVDLDDLRQLFPGF